MRQRFFLIPLDWDNFVFFKDREDNNSLVIICDLRQAVDFVKMHQCDASCLKKVVAKVPLQNPVLENSASTSH